MEKTRAGVTDAKQGIKMDKGSGRKSIDDDRAEPDYS